MDWLGRSRPQAPRQDTGSREPDEPPQPTPPAFALPGIKVELFSDTYRISGLLLTRHRRLTDVLLDTYMPTIHVRDASVQSWYDANPTPYSLSMMQISKTAIVCAIPASVAPPAPAQEQAVARIHKVTHRMLLSAPPYEIRGELHMVPEGIPDDALTAIPDAFLPVTNAEVVFLPRAGTAFSASVVIVNKSRVQFMALEARKGRGLGAGSESV